MPMINAEEIIRVAKAVDFAAHHHADQKRKGDRAEPYINHLAEVASLLAQATSGTDPNLVIAGYLHDTIEDQDVTHADLVEAFDLDVADLVQHVTDDKGLPKHQRKALQVEHAHQIPARAQMLKLADKCSNLASILTSPPPWPLERKLEYFDWAAQVAAGCRGANAELEARFAALYARRTELTEDRSPS